MKGNVLYVITVYLLEFVLIVNCVESSVAEKYTNNLCHSYGMVSICKRDIYIKLDALHCSYLNHRSEF